MSERAPRANDEHIVSQGADASKKMLVNSDSGKVMSNSFGPNSNNPRLRRAFAHAMISKHKKGDATYAEAFEAAYNASHTSKGSKSGLGQAVGGVVIDAFSQNHVKDTVTVSGLSPAKQNEIAAKKATGKAFGYSPDVYMIRPDAQDTPKLKGVIQDPIAEGFQPLKPEK